MSDQRMVRVTIPTLNCAAVLDETVQSVLAQDYDANRIAILFADFGSTDGTLEKILGYRREWTGVYSLAGQRGGRTVAAAAQSLWRLQGVPGYPVLVRPGDVLYPRCFTVCVRWLLRAERRGFTADRVLAEADVREKDGAVRGQRPLFRKPCRLRRYSGDSAAYVKKGARHAVMAFGGNYLDGMDKDKNKASTLLNLDFWWNRFAYAGFSTNVLYLPEVLACLREPEPADELDDVLFAFEQALTMFRMTEELPDLYRAGDDFEPLCRMRLAEFALWRSFLLLGQGRGKEAEDCLLLARIISFAVTEKDCWRHMERLLARGDAESARWLKDFFSREEEPDEPERPLSGRLALCWRRLRGLCAGEKTSRFSGEW